MNPYESPERRFAEPTEAMPTHRKSSFRFTLREVLLVVTGICCTLGASSTAYVTGRFSGARKVFDEIDDADSFGHGYGHAGVPLYVDGKPAAILWVEQNTAADGKRHMTIRKPGCGGHWDDISPMVDRQIDANGVAMSGVGDYLEDLLDD